MFNYDIMCFLEYYEDRDAITDPISGLRIPTFRAQNFYQVAQTLDNDPDIEGPFSYLAFNPSGFGSCAANALNDLTIELAALATIVDITDTALNSDNLVITSLYLQNAGQDAFDGSSASLISRYIGSIMEASITEIAVTWTVNPGISQLNAQVPTRKITVDMLNKVRTA